MNIRFLTRLLLLFHGRLGSRLRLRDTQSCSEVREGPLVHRDLKEVVEPALEGRVLLAFGIGNFHRLFSKVLGTQACLVLLLKASLASGTNVPSVAAASCERLRTVLACVGT